MLHELPIRNVRLAACSVEPAQLTPVAGGHFCADCQCVVHDFTQADADALAAASAAAPGGRLCGRFRFSQLAPESRPAPLQLRRRVRQFLLVAVLVLLRGLTAGQAWAQAQTGAAEAAAPRPTEQQEPRVYGYVEQMPQPAGGLDGLMQFLGRNLHYPDPATEGKVFVSFVVQPTGQLTDFKVLKSLSPAFDAEALRVLRLMPAWTPGTQNGRPAAMSYTLPITFSNAP